MAQYISKNGILQTIRTEMRSRILRGLNLMSLKEILHIVKSEPVYDTDIVIKEIIKVLVDPDKTKNCLSGSGTSLVIVTNQIIEEVIELIESGGIKHYEERK